MATEILVNDGGAPARILPFVAAATITAGDLLEVVSGATTVQPNSSAVNKSAGVALTAAATGEMVNVIAGSGVIVKVIQQTNLAAGAQLMIGSNVGEVIAYAYSASAHKEMLGVTLEDVAAGAYVKVLLY